MKRNILILVFCLTAGWVSAQNWRSEIEGNKNYGKFNTFQISGHTGSHLYTGRGLEGFLDNGYAGVEIRLGWQSTGKEWWQANAKFPSYGIGYYSGVIGDPEVMGNPNALYLWFSQPLTNPNLRHVLIWELAVGLTYDLKAWDPEDNPYNDAIGSSATVYFNANIGGKSQLNREMDLTYGIDLTHFSNGRSFTPNYGLNMFGVNVGMRYHFNPMQKFVQAQDPELILAVRPTYEYKTAPPKPKGYDISAYLAVGTVQAEPEGDEEGARYGTSSFVIDFRRVYAHKGAWYIGADVFYDASLYEKSNEIKNGMDPVPGDYVNLGAHIGHEYNIWNVGLVTQVGTYLYKTIDARGNMWMRVGANYKFSDRFFAQVSLKTQNGAAADWIEWGVGYRLVRHYRRGSHR